MTFFLVRKYLIALIRIVNIIQYLLGSANVGMKDFDYMIEHRDDLIREIDYHQKMEFELQENLKELDYLIKSKDFALAKQKLGV